VVDYVALKAGAVHFWDSQLSIGRGPRLTGPTSARYRCPLLLVADASAMMSSSRRPLQPPAKKLFVCEPTNEEHRSPSL